MVKFATIRCSGLTATDAIDLGNFKSAHLQLPLISSIFLTASACVYMEVFNSTTSSWSSVGAGWTTGNTNPASGSSALAPWVLSSTIGGYSVNLAPACELGTIRFVTGGTNTMTAATNMYVLVGTGYAL